MVRGQVGKMRLFNLLPPWLTPRVESEPYDPPPGASLALGGNWTRDGTACQPSLRSSRRLNGDAFSDDQPALGNVCGQRHRGDSWEATVTRHEVPHSRS
jgi:hypothetical protein